MEQKRSEKERESKLISSNLHGIATDLRIVLVGCTEFQQRARLRFFRLRNSIFANVPFLRKSREKSGRRTFPRRVYASGHEQSVPNSLARKLAHKRTSGALERKLFADSFIDMDDVTAGRCVLLSRSSNWSRNRCYMPGVICPIFFFF